MQVETAEPSTFDESLAAARHHMSEKRYEMGVQICDEIITQVAELEAIAEGKDKVIADCLECIGDIRAEQKDFHKALAEYERGASVLCRKLQPTDPAVMNLLFKMERTLSNLYEQEMHEDGGHELDKRWQTMLLRQAGERLNEGNEVVSEVELDAQKAAELRRRAKKQIKRGTGKKFKERLEDFAKKLLRETDFMGFMWGIGLITTLAIGSIMTYEIAQIYKDYSDQQKIASQSKDKASSKAADQSDGRHSSTTPFMAADMRKKLRFKSNGQAELVIDGVKSNIPFFVQKPESPNWIRYLILCVTRKNYYLQSCDVGLIDQEHTIYFDTTTPDFALIRVMQKNLAATAQEFNQAVKKPPQYSNPQSKGKKTILFHTSTKTSPEAALLELQNTRKINQEQKWQIHVIKLAAGAPVPGTIICGTDGEGKLISVSTGGSKYLGAVDDVHTTRSLSGTGGVLVSYTSIPVTRATSVIGCGFLFLAAVMVGVYGKARKWKISAFIVASFFLILTILGLLNNYF